MGDLSEVFGGFFSADAGTADVDIDAWPRCYSDVINDRGQVFNRRCREGSQGEAPSIDRFQTDTCSHCRKCRNGCFVDIASTERACGTIPNLLADTARATSTHLVSART
jgi:MinD superfamily P-loop ATPase